MKRHEKQPIARYVAMALGAIVALAGATTAAADGLSDRIDIHGFGYQSYLQTSKNTYLDADDKGSFDNNSYNLVVTAKLDEKSKLWAMIDTDSDGVRLGWAFVDYAVNDNFVLKAGQSKEPWGWYNEIFDARYLHMSTVVPHMYSDAADMRDEAYRGVGVSYAMDAGAGRLSFDAYGGAPVVLNGATDAANEKTYGLIGGVATYATPINGLRFRVSGFTHSTKTDGITTREKSVVGGVEYVADNWDVKSEYARRTKESAVSSYYVQAGYTFADHWTPFGRYDYVVLDKSMKNDPSYYQKTFVLGLDYKVNNYFSVRVENHFNKGYGLPVASGEVEAGAGSDKWNMFGASVNFIF
jgi:hypothetical protein